MVSRYRLAFLQPIEGPTGATDAGSLVREDRLASLGHGAEVEVSIILAHALCLLLNLRAARVDLVDDGMAHVRRCEFVDGVLQVVEGGADEGVRDIDEGLTEAPERGYGILAVWEPDAQLAVGEEVV